MAVKRSKPIERADDVLEVQNAVLVLSLGVRGVGHRLTGNTKVLRCLAHQRRCLGELDMSWTILPNAALVSNR